MVTTIYNYSNREHKVRVLCINLTDKMTETEKKHKE